MEEQTIGEVAIAAEASAPGSIQVDGYIVTYIGSYEYADERPAYRWCFTCRERTAHSTVTVMPIGETVDTPLAEIHCANCGGKDTDLFPGKEREDDQPE